MLLSDPSHLLCADQGAALLSLKSQRLLQLLTSPLLLLQQRLQLLQLLPDASTCLLLQLLHMPHVLRLHQTERSIRLPRLQGGRPGHLAEATDGADALRSVW